MSWQLGSLKTPHLRMRSALVEFSLMTQTSILSTSFGEVWTKNFGALLEKSQCYDVIAHRKILENMYFLESIYIFWVFTLK